MATRSDTPSEELSRKPLKAELRVYYGPSQDRMLFGYSVDLSPGGLFLNTETEFSVNDMVILSFAIPDVNKIVNCKAKVAWVNLKETPKKPELPPGIGLQFIDLSSEYMKSIQSLLQHDAVKPANGPEE